MKTQVLIIFSLFGLCFGSCSESEKPVPTTQSDSLLLKARADSMTALKPTETFRGTYKNEPILFSHAAYQVYTLTTGAITKTGKLNTERGYGDYPDATLYVLDHEKPENEQTYFVQTHPGSFFMLDADRYVMDEVVFDLPAAVDVKPLAVKEPVAIKKPVAVKKPATVRKSSPVKTAKKTRVKKHAVRKSSKEKNIRASRTVKKAPAKKIGKSTRKKKPVRSKRKKNRKKKPAPETQKQGV